MTLPPVDSATATNRMRLGIVLGSLSGILAAALGVPGLLVLALVITASALVPPRFALLAGVLIAAGGIWLYFSLRAVMFCAMDPSACSGPGPGPFAVASGAVLALGLITHAATRRRMRRQRDLQHTA